MNLSAVGAIVAGVDVGGTFTDLVLFDARTGRVQVAKTPTTSSDPSQGVLGVIDGAGVDAGLLDLIVHGTTVTTNALLQRRIARAGMITTLGFRDVIELGRRTRPHAYGLIGSFTPLIPRNLRIEVAERTDAQGNIVTPLDEAGLRLAVAHLLDVGCESLVIHFLHSYRNPANEQRAAEIATALWPNLYVTAGHALLSEAREYERGVTAAVSASVQPVLDRYLARLRGGLSARGYSRDFLVMNGNGGTVSSRLITREAARTVMSGPASGVIAAARIGARAGITDLITYDMGGTSTDVALVRGTIPATSHEIALEYGMPIHLPMLDVHTVGAGGGSVARIDSGGLLRIGPESAGSDPGPICYGRGGTRPTISDANALLGRLDAAALIGVDHPVDMAALAAVFAADLGAALGRDATAAAEAVLQVANLKMADAIRMVTVGRGFDLRDYVLFAFGGAGPLHACDIARELGLSRVLIPARPGLTNAIGCAVADLRHDYVATVNVPLEAADPAALAVVLADQAAAGQAALAAEAVRPVRIDITHAADMQFVGQTHLVRVALPDAHPDIADIQARFESAYFDRFRVQLPEVRAKLVSLCTTVVGVRPDIDLSRLIDPAGRGATVAAALVGRRPVRFGGQWHDTPVYRRELLPVDMALSGPAVIVQMDATTVLPPGDRAVGDADGNLIVTIGGAE
jgi:N-methylhydantoinase A